MPGCPLRISPTPPAWRPCCDAYARRAGSPRKRPPRRPGISLNTYSRIERGHTTPSWATVMQLADALDVSMAELGALIDER